MAKAGVYTPAALVIGLLSSADEQLESLISVLENKFGPLLEQRGPFDFSYTTYYDQEMGSSIKRYFYLFEDLVDPAQLALIKIATNEIEEQFSQAGKRVFNLDPGLLSGGNFILATAKNYSHRIALNYGIYAEVTLMYRHKEFQCLEWTYPDYQSETVRSLLLDFREHYMDQLKHERSK